MLALSSSSALAAFSITSATLDGGATTSVSPSASISTSVTLNYFGNTNGANGSWGSTRWSVNGVHICTNHADHAVPGPDSVTFNITAPATPGQYDVTLQAFSNNSCGGQNSAAYTLANGIDVVNPTPIAEYRFDASTATDASGNHLNGTLNGGVTTGVAGKVCSAYKFNGSNAYVSVPHNTLLNLSRISVGAWVRHTSGAFKSWETILAKGDSAFRLHTNGGCSINTPNPANGLSFGINGGCSSADANSGVVPVTNQWYHVFGTYDGSTIRIYVNGVLRASGSYAGSISSNTFPLYIGENSQQRSRYWTGDIDEVKIFGSALSATEIAAGYANENAGNNWDGTARTCSGTSTAPAALNAVDVAANAVSGKISTKTAGTAFSLDIYALNAARTAQDSAASGDVLVDLLANTATGVTLDANNCPTAATTLSVGTVSLTAGKATAAIGAIANSWRDVRVRMRYPATGTATLTACSSDNFAVKPSSLAAIASHADWQTAGTTTTLANTGASGGIVHKAGRPFTLRVTGYNASNAITSNYNGSPAASTTCVLPASGCVAGTFATGTFTASAGTASSHTASYSEVGAIAATLADTGYASVDSGDTAASCAGYWACASAINIGRFVPDHFDISANTPAFIPACGGFTYLGQPFGFGTAPVWTVTARNAAGNTTQNYTGSLFKISAATVTGQVWSDPAHTVAAVGSLPGVSVADAGGGVGMLTFDVGNPNAAGGLAYNRAALTAAFDASLNLAASVADSEGISYVGNPYQQTGIGFDDANAVTGNDAQMRFGRLRSGNANGSELLALPLPLAAQYWNGQGFVGNPADSCTALTAPGLTFYPQTTDNQLASGETTASFNATLAAGNGNLRLSAPGVGNFGYLDLAISAPDWLKYNWDGVDQGSDGNLFDDNPRARAAFGKRKGSEKVIIRREIY